MRRITLFLSLISSLLLASCGHKSSKHNPTPAINRNPTSGTGLTAPDSELRKKVWGSSVYRPSLSSCTVIYDLRRVESFDFHIFCLARDNQSIQLESYEYGALNESSQSILGSLQKSSCAQSRKTINLRVALTGEGKLGLSSGNEYNLLQGIKGEELLVDLRTATSMYGKPIVRGCFMDEKFEKFQVLEAAP